MSTSSQTPDDLRLTRNRAEFVPPRASARRSLFAVGGVARVHGSVAEGTLRPAADDSIDIQARPWHSLVRDWVTVGGATTVCQGLGVVTSLGLRMLLSPAQMGIWQALKLFLSYGNYANLGVSKGAVRQYTVARGQGDTARAERGLKLAFTVNTMTSVVYMTLLVAVALILLRGPWTARTLGWAVGLMTVGLLAVVSRYVTFHVTILRAQRRFDLTSRLSVWEAVLTLSVCLLATWAWGLIGLCLGTVAVMLGALGFVLGHRTVRLGWAWDRREVGRLIAIGAPILLAGTVSSLFRSLDKLMILGMMPHGEFHLGCYSMAIMVCAQLYGLGNMLATVMNPRYGEHFGATGDRAEVARLAARSSELQAMGIALPAAISLAVGPPVLAWLLPEYVSGLAAMIWLVPGCVATVLALPASQYLVAVGQERRALGAVTISTVFAALGNALVLAGGGGLAGVAMATTAAYIGYYVLIVAVSIWPVLAREARRRYLIAVAMAVAPPLGVAILLGGQATWPRTLAALAAILVVWLAVGAVGWTRGDWRSLLKKQDPTSGGELP